MELSAYIACGSGLALWYVVCRAAERALFGAVEESKLRRKRAWFLTLPVSFYFGFLLGPVYIIGLLRSMWEGAPAVVNFLTAETGVGRHACILMVTFLVLDLVIGIIDYREQIKMLTGWIHHVLYILLYASQLHTGGTQYLIVGACCEIPTFILAVGTAFPSMRSDMAFGVTFFFTRIVWFLFMFIVYSTAAYNSFIPVAVYGPPNIGALLLHCYWWRSWLVSYTKKDAQ
jgi:hypothetical protein